MDQYSGLLILAVLLVLLWVFSVRNRRQQRRQAEVQTALQVGDRVMTTSGLFGTIVAVDDPQTVDLEVASGVRTTWVRPAIGRVVEAPSDETTDGPDRSAGPLGPVRE